MVGLRPAIDLKGLITAVQALEAQTLSRFNTAVSDARAGPITGDQFSRIVKKELLPPWERRRAELAELKLTPDQQRVTASVISYMQLRGESWGLLADGRTDEQCCADQDSAAKAWCRPGQGKDDGPGSESHGPVPQPRADPFAAEVTGPNRSLSPFRGLG
jgi:hypothetical protein